MGKIILSVMFLISIVGNIYLMFLVYYSTSYSVFEQIGIVVFAVSNLIILILSIAWYFVFRIRKSRKQ
jgi:hypothetical protein